MQVCQSADDYQGYDRELGLCVCKQPPGRSPCDGSCRRKLVAQVKLQCRTGEVTELVHNNWVRRGQKGIVFTCLVLFIPAHFVSPLNHLAVMNRSTMLHVQREVKNKYEQFLMSNVIVCVCRCHLSQAACWRQSSNSGTPGGASCAAPKSAPHIWSILFRQQVQTCVDTT